MQLPNTKILQCYHHEVFFTPTLCEKLHCVESSDEHFYVKCSSSNPSQ